MDTVTISPYIFDLLGAVKDALQDNPEHEARVRDVILQHAQSQSIRDLIADEVAILGQTVMGIEKDFHTISIGVRHIDAQALLRNHDSSPKRFLPRWLALHEEYTALMIDSQKSASRMNSKISSFIEHIIPIVENARYTTKQKQSSLGFYIQSLEEFQTQGESTERQFSLLANGVARFKEDLTQATTSVDQINNAKITDLRVRIDELERQFMKAAAVLNQTWDVLATTAKSTSMLVAAAGTAGGAYCHFASKTVSTIVAAEGGLLSAAASVTTASGATYSATVATGGGSVMAASTTTATGLAALAPAASIALLLVGVGALGYSIHSGFSQHSAQMKMMSVELAVQRQKLSSLEAQAPVIGAMLGELSTLDPVFVQLIQRLVTMQRIWRNLIVDAQTLQNELDELQSSPDPLLFSVATGHIKTLYTTLQIALDNYTLQVPTFHS